MILWLLWGAEAPAAPPTELTPQQIELVRYRKNLLLGCMQGGRSHFKKGQMVPIFHNNWVTVDSFPSAYAEGQYDIASSGESEESYARRNGYACMEATKYARPDIVYDLSNPYNLFKPFKDSLRVVVSESVSKNLINTNLIDNARYALQEGGWLIFLGFDPKKLGVPMRGFEEIDLWQQSIMRYPDLVAILKDLGVYGTGNMPNHCYRKLPGGYRGFQAPGHAR